MGLTFEKLLETVDKFHKDNPPIVSTAVCHPLNVSYLTTLIHRLNPATPPAYQKFGLAFTGITIEENDRIPLNQIWFKDRQGNISDVMILNTTQQKGAKQ